jgi:hypothetical protein
VRLQFAKVAEFQRRGIIHFHALIRLDGPPTDTDAYPSPTVEVTSGELAGLIRDAALLVRFDAPPVDRGDLVRRLAFGVQLDVRPVTGTANRDQHGGELHPETVAAYIAKYATKAAADTATGQQGPNPHLRRLRATLDQLAVRSAVAWLGGDDQPYQGWGRWADMLGFRGHPATKSRRYSVTLGRLRQARRDYTRRHVPRSPGLPVAVTDDQAEDEASTLVIGSWRFAGMGWLTSGDAALAAASAARARDA